METITITDKITALVNSKGNVISTTQYYYFTIPKGCHIEERNRTRYYKTKDYNHNAMEFIKEEIEK